jgi:hypothetical protein
MKTRYLHCLVSFSCLLSLGACLAQEKGLKDLAASLSSQVKQRGKGPVAITSFVGNGYCAPFSRYIVDRLNIFIARGNADFDVVTRDRVEEVFKEINLALGKNYDASTFSRIGRQLGARELIRGSYTIQPLGATVSIAAQLVDVETGRIIGGEVADVPYTGDVKAMLASQDCPNVDSSTSQGAQPLSEAPSTDKHDASPALKATENKVVHTEMKRVGQLEVRLKGCRSVPEGILCEALLTNVGEERQYCLVSKADNMMSRIVDVDGNVHTPSRISLAEKSGNYSMWECAMLPSRIPVAASILFTNGAGNGRGARLPNEGSQLQLLEFGFDLVNYAGRSPTAMFAQFRSVLVTQ